MSNQILISSGAKLRDLDDVIIGTDGVLTSLGFNVANGVPKLDENGKILVSQLPNSVMEFKGVWDAATNTPTLANGTGNAGDVYLCNVAGTVNFGAGPIAFAVGDYAVYTGTVWARSSGATGTVTSVGLSRSGDALTVTGSPITTSGTINIGFAGTNLQYINGAGNLVTFPTIAQEAQRLITEVYNDTGATLTKGTIVYINGGQGNLPTVTKAIATGDSTSAQTYGIVQNDISNMDNGFVVVIGSLTDLDTQAYPEGTQLYLSGTTAGAWTSTKPYAPVHLVYVAIVTRSHPTQGVVEVSIQNGYEMDELHNVAAQNPDNNDILQYKTSTSLWTKVAGTTSNIAEGSRLYFTDARARQSISLTTTGSTGAATYDNTTGVLNIPNYVDQYVGTVTSVGLSAPTGFSVTGSPVTSSGTLALSFASGYSLPTNVKQSNWDDAYTWVAAFPTQTGNNGKFLTTDGSALSWATVIAGVQSVTASSPLSSSGGANPNITIQVATTSQNGYLSSTDWNTFNGKQNALTLTTTGSSGAATLIGSTLNIPNYGSALSGYVPYTGATGAVNLGANNLTAQIGFFTNAQTFFANISTDVNGGYIQAYKASDTTYHPFRIIAGSNTTTAKSFTLNNTGATLNTTLFGTAASFSSSITSETFIQTSGIGTYLRAGGYIWAGGSGGDYGSVGYNIGYNSTTAGSYTYVVNDFASMVRFDSGGFNFLTAPTGAIGDAITFTPRVRFLNNGNVLIRTNTDSGFNFDVNGTGRFSNSLNIDESLFVNTGTGATFRAVYAASNQVEIGNYSAASGYRQLNIVGSTIVLGTGTAGGGSAVDRLTISPLGNINLAGALSGTSATFSGSLGVGTASLDTFLNVKSSNTSGTTMTPIAIFYKNSVKGGTLQISSNDSFADIKSTWYSGATDMGLTFTVVPTSGVDRLALTIASNTTATFSSSVTAGGGISSTAPSAFVNAYSTNPANDAIVSAYWSATSALEMRYNANTAVGYIQSLYANVSGQPFGDIHIRQSLSGTMVTRMLFKNDGGKILINTLSEVSGGGALQVNGNVNINGVFQINGTTIGGGGGSGVTGSGTTNYVSKWTGSSSLGNSLIYDTGSYVSMNTTTNPNLGGFTNTTLLLKQVADGVVGGGLQIEQNGNTNVAFFGFTGSEFRIGTSYRSTGSYQPIVFSTNGPNRLRIENNGNILIATDTDNGYKLQINGSASFAYGFLSVYRGSSSPNDILVGNSGSVFYIGGNTQVVGSVSASGGFFDTSDRRLKTLVEDNYLLSSIANVKAKLYIKDGRKELGYYAQDLEGILPSAVKEGSDGFLSLSYAQVHTAKIAVIEDEVTILKNRVSQLEKQLNLN